MSNQQNKVKEKNNAKPEEKKLLKILMIHGYRQSEASFRERSGSLRKSLKNFAEFVFCEAPHAVTKQNEEEEKSEQKELGWWFSQNSPIGYDAWDITDYDYGFEDSLNYINKVFESQGPFDGIFAFSQGACLGSILSRISSSNDEKFKFIRFKFSILVAGFKSGQTMHNSYYDLNNKIDLPSLHLIGTGDKVIPSEMALKLIDYFVEPKIHMHDGGHFIPVNAESKKLLTEFLAEIKDKIFSK